MKKIIRVAATVVKVILYAVVALLLVYNVYILAARYLFHNGMPTFFGFGIAAVASGSMEPEISTGDLVVTRTQGDYAQGDVIIFYDAESGSYITHRIILVSDGMYATKGDANDSADNFSVPSSAVVGKVVAVLPNVGKAVGFLQSPLGLVAVLGAGAVIWLLTSLLPEVFGGKKNGTD